MLQGRFGASLLRSDWLWRLMFTRTRWKQPATGLLDYWM